MVLLPADFFNGLARYNRLALLSHTGTRSTVLKEPTPMEGKAEKNEEGSPMRKKRAEAILERSLSHEAALPGRVAPAAHA
jgi:hypothetical protein